MDIGDLRSTVRAASEAGLVAVGEGMATFREALPEETRVRAEQAWAGHSPMRRGMVVLAETTAGQVERAGRRVAERYERARAEQAGDQAGAAGTGPRDPGAPAGTNRTALAVVEKEAAVEHAESRGTLWKMALAVVVVGAAAGAGYAIYARRKKAANAHLAGEGEWGAPPVAEAFMPGMADTQSPDVVDEQFAREVDAEAEEIAEDFVEAVEGVSEEVVEVAEPFEPGVADSQGPDAVDEQFAREVDEAAEELAREIVEGIEDQQR